MEDTIPKLLQAISSQHATATAQLSKDENADFQPTSFAMFYREVQELAAGFLALGVTRGDHVGLIADNRKEWFLCDLALLCLGAADVPRGTDSHAGEIAYILGFSGCRTVIAENARQLEKILSQSDTLPELQTAVLIDSEGIEELVRSKLYVVGFEELRERGRRRLGSDDRCVTNEIEKGAREDVATIIFTSGTTGTPKGVMLTHGNFLHQVAGVPELIDVGPGDIWLCVLPVWHSFERIMQYVALGSASCLAYSKPIGQIMLADFQKVKPTWMASVPRIWESLQAGIYKNIAKQGGAKAVLFHFFVAVGRAHAKMELLLRGLMPRFRRRSRLLDRLVGILPYLVLAPLRGLGNLLVFGKIKARLGGRFVAGISGGGALPEEVDDFFRAAGILLLEGYGLTETGPVLGVRAQHHPVPGTVGPVFPGTEIRIQDESGRVLSPGQKGIVFARGPQVMKGYYRQPELTGAILSEDGWINTGDLGMLTFDNELRILGRAKDTLVLRGGENVEPLPIEQKITESTLIDHAMVVGQDQKFLAAILIPNREEIESFASERGIDEESYEELVRSKELEKAVYEIVNNAISPANGFKGFERIARIRLIPADFEQGEELSAKQEIKRHVVAEKYKGEIEEIFST
jgi:long-chain acyl-CoA synthetase